MTPSPKQLKPIKPRKSLRIRKRSAATIAAARRAAQERITMLDVTVKRERQAMIRRTAQAYLDSLSSPPDELRQCQAVPGWVKVQ